MRRRKKKKATNKIKNLSESILKLLAKSQNKSLNYRQLSAKLGISESGGRHQIIKELSKLQAKKKIKETERGKFKLLSAKQYFTGILDITTRGEGYVIVDDLEKDILISKSNLNKAFNGDTVDVFAFHKKKSGQYEGEVVKIVERKQTQFVGIIQIQDNFAFVNCSGSKHYTDFFIPKSKIGKAKDGDKIIVEFDKWPDRAESPYANIIKILGKAGEHQTEIHAILAQYDLPYEFPEAVTNYANAIDTQIKAEEIKKRRDFRDVLTFTIDPKDAKDFDDALSFKFLDNGNYEIGVHIADVSYYMPSGSPLDDEAYERATSVYLVDRVVPMLPEILSNNACSLRPQEEKYTFSAVFEINDNAEVKNQWFGRTVIYSDARFSYEEAQHIIETNADTIPQKHSLTGKPYKVNTAIVKAIYVLNNIAKIKRKRRMLGGALYFNKIEVKFNLNESFDPIGIYFKEAKEANNLIEEFMLLANRKVAEFIGKQSLKKTFIYRIHDEPDIEKIAALANIVKGLGYKFQSHDKKSTTTSLNNLLKQVKGKKEQNMVDTLAIRCMSKAKYTTQNIGHYGLNFDYYSHFTSPIRRYPDVMVHRLLQHYLDKGKSTNEAEYEKKSDHSSTMENLAAKAERDSIKYMQVKYMSLQDEDEYLGVISGVTEWGIFVEIISNKCEGLIRLQDLKDDHYIFDKDKFAFIGQRTKNIYQLGDEVYIRLKKADLIKRQIDFTLIKKKDDN